MLKPERHGIKQNREFSSDGQFRHLLEWLNTDKDDPGRRRVRKLLRNIRTVTSNWVIVGDEDGEGWKYAGPAEQFAKAAMEILISLRRYKFSPLVTFFGPQLLQQWTPISDPRGKYKRRWPPFDGGYDESQAVYEISFRRWNGGAERVLECFCGKWFCRKFSHQKFCSARCREKANKSTDEWKEYRRQKAREYYWLHKTGSTK